MPASLVGEAMDGMEATLPEPHLSAFELQLDEENVDLCSVCGGARDEFGRCEGAYDA